MSRLLTGNVFAILSSPFVIVATWIHFVSAWDEPSGFQQRLLPNQFQFSGPDNQFRQSLLWQNNAGGISNEPTGPMADSMQLQSSGPGFSANSKSAFNTGPGGPLDFLNCPECISPLLSYPFGPLYTLPIGLQCACTPSLPLPIFSLNQNMAGRIIAALSGYKSSLCSSRSNFPGQKLQYGNNNNQQYFGQPFNQQAKMNQRDNFIQFPQSNQPFNRFAPFSQGQMNQGNQFNLRQQAQMDNRLFNTNFPSSVNQRVNYRTQQQQVISNGPTGFNYPVSFPNKFNPSNQMNMPNPGISGQFSFQNRPNFQISGNIGPNQLPNMQMNGPQLQIQSKFNPMGQQVQPQQQFQMNYQLDNRPNRFNQYPQAQPNQLNNNRPNFLPNAYISSNFSSQPGPFLRKPPTQPDDINQYNNPNSYNQPNRYEPIQSYNNPNSQYDYPTHYDQDNRLDQNGPPSKFNQQQQFDQPNQYDRGNQRNRPIQYDQTTLADFELATLTPASKYNSQNQYSQSQGYQPNQPYQSDYYDSKMPYQPYMTESPSILLQSPITLPPAPRLSEPTLPQPPPPPSPQPGAQFHAQYQAQFPPLIQTQPQLPTTPPVSIQKEFHRARPRIPFLGGGLSLRTIDETGLRLPNLEVDGNVGVMENGIGVGGKISGGMGGRAIGIGGGLSAFGG